MFDTNLSAYHKLQQTEEDEFFVEPGFDEADLSEDIYAGETDYVEPTKSQVAGFDFKTAYSTEPVVEGGEMFIRISPKDGAFVVTFNEKTKTCVVEKESQKGE